MRWWLFCGDETIMSLSIAQSIYENASKVTPTVTRMTSATARSTASQGPSGLVAANDLSLFSTMTMTTSVVESNRFLPASAANSSAPAAAAMLRNGQDERQHNPLALGLGLGLGVGLAVLGLMVSTSAVARYLRMAPAVRLLLLSVTVQPVMTGQSDSAGGRGVGPVRLVYYFSITNPKPSVLLKTSMG